MVPFIVRATWQPNKKVIKLRRDITIQSPVLQRRLVPAIGGILWLNVLNSLIVVGHNYDFSRNASFSQEEAEVLVESVTDNSSTMVELYQRGWEFSNQDMANEFWVTSGYVRPDRYPARAA